jgi:fumarate hydratase class I
MIDLLPHLIELIRQASTSLPADVEVSLMSALNQEESTSTAANALQTILANVKIARQQSVPLCQDTGTPIFAVRYPRHYTQTQLTAWIRTAVAEATALAFLRPNAVDALTNTNNGTNLGDPWFPTIHFAESAEDILTIDLLLKGGGCENVGRQYSLPDDALHAGRDLDGVRKAALDAVFRAQGMGCAPGFLGIAIGGDRGSGYQASKAVFFEPLHRRNSDPDLAALEERITAEANLLGIGPMGFGGNNTVLNTRITSLYRLPASYFVTVSYMCWAYRLRRLTITAETAVMD